MVKKINLGEGIECINPGAPYFSFVNKWNSNYYHWFFDIFLDYLIAKKEGLLEHRTSGEVAKGYRIWDEKWPG